MHFVISVCVTSVLTWLAVFVTARGLQISADAATAFQSSQSNEYLAHYCGSLRATIANLLSASDILQSTDPAQAKDYLKAATAYLSPLEEMLDTGHYRCVEHPTMLHTQSLGETPLNLPNQIYRLTGLDDDND